MEKLSFGKRLTFYLLITAQSGDKSAVRNIGGFAQAVGMMSYNTKRTNPKLQLRNILTRKSLDKKVAKS